MQVQNCQSTRYNLDDGELSFVWEYITYNESKGHIAQLRNIFLQ